jgi:hypothetical protein
MTWRMLAGAGLLAALHSTTVCSQRPAATTGSASTRLVAAAREGTRRYQLQDAAIADGFRRVGVDFPAMGEHWVNLQRVMADSFAPGHPAVLIYVRVNGVPSLAGVAYTALLERGESPPSFAPARGWWHEHNGTIAEESFPIGHHAMERSQSEDDAPLRLSILHAWVWVQNPAGLFATDNWSLPYVRLGVRPPTGAPAAAARALALALDGEDYYALMLRTSMVLAAREDSIATAILSRSRARAARELDGARRDGQVKPAVLDRLSAHWSALWDELERSLPRRTAALRVLQRHL